MDRGLNVGLGLLFLYAYILDASSEDTGEPSLLDNTISVKSHVQTGMILHEHK